MTRDELESRSIPEPNSGCFIWLGAARGEGYGVVRLGSNLDGTRRLEGASRLMWKIVNGPIPEGKIICHRCDNPFCINLDHLFVGTFADNSQDCVKKGRLNHWAWRQTHCKRGHELFGPNLLRSSGRRYCRACMKMRYEAKREGK